MTRKSRELSFEERLARLQTIVAALESGESPLEESVALYKEGLAHTRACREQLAKARHDIEIYQDGACAPFASDPARPGRGTGEVDGMEDDDANDEDAAGGGRHV